MMQMQSRLKLMTVIFAVLWTAGMVWWTAQYDAVHIALLAASGAVVGVLWHWGMSRYVRWSEHQR
jgi:hypothetical protein